MKTEEIVRSLRWCGTGEEEGCGDCAFEPQCDEDAVECVGGLDRIKELAKADKDGRMAILPCEPGGVMLDMSDLERPEMMKRLHFAVAYVRCGIVFHQPYKIFSENVAAGHIRPVSGLAGEMLGEEVWP